MRRSVRSLVRLQLRQLLHPRAQLLEPLLHWLKRIPGQRGLHGGLGQFVRQQLQCAFLLHQRPLRKRNVLVELMQARLARLNLIAQRQRLIQSRLADRLAPDRRLLVKPACTVVERGRLPRPAASC